MPRDNYCTTSHHYRSPSRSWTHRIRRCPGRRLWNSSLGGCSCQISRHHSGRLRTAASRRRLRCTLPLPVGICRWARHRSWMTSTRLRTRALWPTVAPLLSDGRAGNWSEDGLDFLKTKSVVVRNWTTPLHLHSQTVRMGIGQKTDFPRTRPEAGRNWSNPAAPPLLDGKAGNWRGSTAKVDWTFSRPS